VRSAPAYVWTAIASALFLALSMVIVLATDQPSWVFWTLPLTYAIGFLLGIAHR